jgi:hypothetical protein
LGYETWLYEIEDKITAPDGVRVGETVSFDKALPFEVNTMGITMIDSGDLGDVAGMLRRLADRREAELGIDWEGIDGPETFVGKRHIANLREDADYHERQSTKRKD